MSAVIARARACVGARFRLQGRDPATGLDCVGVAAFACGVAAPPARYAMRGGDEALFRAMIAGAGLVPVPEARPGCVVMLRAGAAQLHLAVLTETGFVHADARLRRVVEVPGVVKWPVVGCWRFFGSREGAEARRGCAAGAVRSFLGRIKDERTN